MEENSEDDKLKHIYSQPSDVFSNCPFIFDMDHLKLENKEQSFEY
jgi:hypothetical protein